MSPKTKILSFCLSIFISHPAWSGLHLGRPATASDSLTGYGGTMEVNCGGSVNQCNFSGVLNEDGDTLTNAHCFPGGKSCQVVSMSVGAGVPGRKPIHVSCPSGVQDMDKGNDMAVFRCKVPKSVPILKVDARDAKAGRKLTSVHRNCKDKGIPGVKCEGSAHVSEGSVTGKERNVIAHSSAGSNVVNEVTQTTNNACVGSSGSAMHGEDGSLALLLNSGKGECGAAGGISGHLVAASLERMGIKFSKADGSREDKSTVPMSFASGSSASSGDSVLASTVAPAPSVVRKPSPYVIPGCEQIGGFEKMASIGLPERNLNDLSNLLRVPEILKFNDEPKAQSSDSVSAD